MGSLLKALGTGPGSSKKPEEDGGNIVTNFFGDVGDFVGGLGQLGGAILGDAYRGVAEAVTLGGYTGGQDRPQGQWNLDDVFINLTGLDPGDLERSQQTQSALVEGLKQWGNPGEYLTEHPGFALLDILSLGTAAGAGAKALGTGTLKSAAAKGVPSAVKALDDLTGATRRMRPGIVGRGLDELAAGGGDIGGLGTLASKILPRPQSRLLASIDPGAESRFADIVEVTPSANPVARMLRQPFERFITEPIERIEQHVAGMSEGLKAGILNPKQAPLIRTLEEAVESARKAGVVTAYKPFATNQQLRWAVNKISGQSTSLGYLERDRATKAMAMAQRPVVEAGLVDEAAEFYQDIHLPDEVFGMESVIPRFTAAGRKTAAEGAQTATEPGLLKAVVPEGAALGPGATRTTEGFLQEVQGRGNLIEGMGEEDIRSFAAVHGIPETGQPGISQVPEPPELQGINFVARGPEGRMQGFLSVPLDEAGKVDLERLFIGVLPGQRGVSQGLIKAAMRHFDVSPKELAGLAGDIPMTAQGAALLRHTIVRPPRTAVATLDAVPSGPRPLDTVRGLDPLEAYERLPQLESPDAPTSDLWSAPERYVSPQERTLTVAEASVRANARALKGADPAVVGRAADAMAPSVSPGDVLVPIPTHLGDTSANRALAEAIAQKTGATVADVLETTGRASSSQALRHAGRAGLTAAEHPIALKGTVPAGSVVFIDNVVTTGATFQAARNAVGRGRGLAYAKAKEILPTEGGVVTATQRVQEALAPAVERLRQLRQTPDVDPEELALTERYVQAGLEPALVEAEVRLGRKVSPLVLAKERTRLEIMERWDNRMVQFGGHTYASLAERTFRPLRMRFGGKFEADGTFVGPSITQLDDALRAAGETAPIYFPHFDSGRPPSFMDWLMRRANVRSAANKPGYFQRSRMELFKADRYIKDPAQALARRAAQQTGWENTLRQITALDEVYGRDVSPHDIIGPGEVVYAPEAINRTFRGIIKLDDDVAAALMRGADPDAAAVEALKQIVKGNGTQMVRDLLSIVGPKAKLRVMPKVVADQLGAYTKYRFGKGVKLFWDTPTGVWKSMVLLGSPRWVVNNFLGNALFLKMQGGRFRGVIAQLDKEYRAMLRSNPEISGFLDQVTRGMFGRDFRSTEQLGTAASSATGRIYERVGKNPLVRGARKLGQKTADSNQLLENAYRIEGGITALERQAVPSSIKRLGRMFWSSKKRLEDLTRYKFSPAQIEAALKEAERFFGNYWRYSPFEKNVIRRFAMPFWGFYRHTLKLAATFPVEFAGRAELLRSLGEASMEFQRDLGPLPEWLADRGFPVGPGAEGEELFHLIGSANPMEFVGQAVTDPFRALVGSAPPGIKIPLEQGLGRSTFTGEEFTSEDVVTPFGSDQSFRIDPETGESLGPVEKTTPGLLEHVARQFPQYELMKDLLAGGATYDTASLPDIIGGGGVIRDEATGEPKYPDDAFERLLRLFGVSTVGYDVAGYQQQLAQDEQAALREALRRQVAGSGPVPTSGGGGGSLLKALTGG